MQTIINKTAAKEPARKYLLFIITLHYRLNIFCTYMIGKTLSFQHCKCTSFHTNKQTKKAIFRTKTNFFQLRKIFTREYIKHAPGTLPARFRHARKVLLLFLYSCFLYTNKQQREKEDHFNK